MIDAYDVLNLPLDAADEDIKKAYKRMSLQHHPDKVQAQGLSTQDAGVKFMEIKTAHDILSCPERRKIYDTFGLDLEDERPEGQVWNIGIGTLLSPMGGFLLRTFLFRLAVWIIDWTWVGRILMLMGIIIALLYAVDFKYEIQNTKIRDPEAMPILVIAGIVDGVILVYWIWPLLADGVGVFYLVSELVGITLLLDGWKVGTGAAIGSLVLARLFRGWWLWILGIQVFLAIIMLAALTVAAGIVCLWIDSVQAQHGHKLRSWRQVMRKRFRELEEEAAELRRRLELKKTPPRVVTVRR